MSILPISADTPVFHHAAPFATEPTLEGVLTRGSIRKRQRELNDTSCPLALLRREAVLNSVADNPTVAHVCQSIATNQAKSGIWNDDGTLNVERLRELHGRCVTITEKGLDGEDKITLVLTRAIFQRFIDERRARINTGCTPNIIAFGNLTHVGFLLVPHTKVTDGSIDALFHAYPHPTKYREQATIAWNDVSTFYDPLNIAKLRA